MRISDWSSDVCSSDLKPVPPRLHAAMTRPQPWRKLPTMPRKSASPDATETSPVADFEASLDALEQLVAKMEHGELSLAQSPAAYERGVRSEDSRVGNEGANTGSLRCAHYTPKQQ